MRKIAYKSALSVLLFFAVCYPTREQEMGYDKLYIVGNYRIKEREGMFQAQKGAVVSSWQNTMYKSIKEIQ